MSEPSTVITPGLGSGVSLVSVAAISLGPILGESVVILALGLLGTLIALSEDVQPSWKSSLVFVLKGVIFSFVFTGIGTTIVLDYLPKGMGLTPYAVMGAVAFMIGWTSNKWSKLKDWFISLMTKEKS